MEYKKGLIFICLVICLFSIASVVASDVNDTKVTSDNLVDDIITIEEDSNQINDEKLLIDSEDSEIILESDSDNKVYDGNGTNSGRMSIAGNNVTLKNYIFANNYIKQDYTPGALSWSGNNGKIINCTFVSNSGSPGALLVTGANCTVINCTFKNNKLNLMQFAGAVVWRGDNGTIINSEFSGTESSNEGGAIYWSAPNAKIINCTFNNNRAWRGGAIQFASYYKNCNNAQVINSTFISNSDSQGGSAIYCSAKNVTIECCNFTNNVGTYGIFCGANLVTNCIFYNNRGYSSASSASAMISSSNFNNCLFLDNYAKEDCYCIISANNITNCIFLNNYAKSGYKNIVTATNLNYNWFGNTLNDYDIIPTENNKLKNWLFLNATHEQLMLVGKQMPISFVFQVWDGTNVLDYDSSKVFPVALNLSATNGQINKIFSIVGEEILYNASAVSNGSITVKFFDRQLTIDFTCKKPTEIITNDSITIYVDQSMNFTGDKFSAILIPSEAGNLTYSTDNETILNVTVCGFTGFNGGIANLIVEFKETDEYAPFKVLVPVTVLKYDTEITTTDSITMNYNDSQTIIAELTPNVGNFIYSSDDEDIATVNIEGVLYAVGTGTTTINVIFEGNRKYYPNSKTIQLTVNKINSSINLTKDIEFNYGGSDYVVADIDGVSSIQAYVIDHSEATVTVKNNKITVSGLDVGNYTLIAITVPDNNHISVNTTCSITVHKSNSSVSIPSIKFNYGSSATVNANLNGATGLINVKVENHTEALIYISGNQITVSELDAGTYTLILTTVPDSNHNAVNATATITVNKVNSVIEFTNDLIFDYERSDYTSVNIQYATNITDIKVKNHPEAVINVEGNIITVSGLNAGHYTLSATTIPDKNHNAVTGTAKITVNKINSTLTIENDVIFDYGMSNVTYAVFEGATSIKASVVGYSSTINVVGSKITVCGLNAGNYTLYVYTVPDSNHNSVKAYANITVNKVDPIITVSPVIFDFEQVGSTRILTTSNVNFEALVLNHTEATIEIVGKRIYVSNLETGNYTLEINAISNNNYNSINLTTNITVNKVDSIIAASNIVFDYGSYGSTIVNLNGADKFNASVIDHPEAMVAIVGNEIFVSSLDVGAYYLNITSIPDKNHNAITFTPRITVNKVNASIIIPTIEFDYGTSVTVYPTLDGVTNISYAFVSNHKEATVDITEENGITLSGLNAGKYTLVVTVTPDDNHNPISTVTSDIIVNKIDSTIMVPEINFNYGLYGSTKVTLNGATKFNANINGDSTHISINDDGVIIVFGLTAGTYDLVVTTVPDSNHNPITTVSKVIVNKLGTVLSSNDITTTYGTSKNIVLKLNDVNGNLLTDQSVKITLNNVVYSTKTNSNGQAVITIPNKLPIKSHVATITFEGNTNNAKSTTTIKVTVNKATPKITAKEKTFKKSVKIKKYTIVLKNNLGKAINKAKVTIKVGKKTFTAKTNSKGKATFKIKKLTKKGTYKSTVTYKGNAYYNKVTKKVKIKVK